MALVTEDQVELQSIEWFKDLGYQYVCGYDIAVDGETPERTDYPVILKESTPLSTRINPEHVSDRCCAFSTDRSDVLQSTGAFVVNQRGEGHLSGR